MEQLNVENELRAVVSRLVSQVELATAQGRTDINVALEDALIPVLQTVYNLPNLENLNRKHRNFPGIDLGDQHDRVAYQVSSTTTLKKVKKTVGQFRDKDYMNSFDELFILMLLPKQKSYSQDSINIIVPDGFVFDVKRHIIDLSDVVREISHLRLTAQKRVLRLFRQMLGDVDAMVDLGQQKVESARVLTSNLQAIELPRYIYVGEVSVDDGPVVEWARQSLDYKRRKPTKSTLVKFALMMNGTERDDWLVFENRIFSFRDVETCSLSAVTAEGSVERLDVSELAGSEEPDNVNIVKYLLVREMKHRLHDVGVEFHHREKLFFFTPLAEESERKEVWVGKSKAVRTVYWLKMSKADPDKVDHHKHLAFGLSFTDLGGSWFAQIIPDYLHTFNGYRKSFIDDKLTARQKRLDRNPAVRNAVRFIAYFLRNLGTGGDNSVTFAGLVAFDQETDNYEDPDSVSENGDVTEPAEEVAA